MKNQDTMTLKLSCIEVCDLRIALLSVAQGFKTEASEAEKTGDIDTANRAKKNAEKWFALRDKIIEQFDEQDKAVD